jgi:hypothetical protein
MGAVEKLQTGGASLEQTKTCPLCSVLPRRTWAVFTYLYPIYSKMTIRHCSQHKFEKCAKLGCNQVVSFSSSFCFDLISYFGVARPLLHVVFRLNVCSCSYFRAEVGSLFRINSTLRNQSMGTFMPLPSLPTV